MSTVKKELYDLLVAKLVADAPSIRHIDRYNNQLDRIQEELPINFPAVFISFNPTPYVQDNNAYLQRGEPTIDFYIAVNKRDSITDEDWVASQEVYEALQGFEGDFFHKLERINETEDNNRDEIAVNIMSFNCMFHDHTAFTDNLHQIDQFNVQGRLIVADPPFIPTALNSPINLIAIATSGTVIDLNWDLQTTIEDSVRVEMADDNLVFSEVANLSAGVVSHSVTSLTDDQIYFFRVRVEKDNDFSRYSGVVIQKTTVEANTIIYEQAVTNQTNIYRSRDDGDRLSNGDYDVISPSKGIPVKADPNDRAKLLTLNKFGNYDLWTDDVGGQEYGTGSNGSTANILDNHLIGRHFWDQVLSATWNTLVDNSPTVGAYSNLYLCNARELQHAVIMDNGIANRLNYAPWNNGTFTLIVSSSTKVQNFNSKWGCETNVGNNYVVTGFSGFTLGGIYSAKF